MTESSHGPPGPDQGRYNPARGASAYAPLVGTFGALAVAAIVVLFTTTAGALSATELALAAGLLAVGVFGSVTGSFGLAAIGAEEDVTANLVPAMMYIAVPVSTCVVATLSAFEVLARAYIPKSAWLFIVVVAGGAFFAVALTALALADSTSAYPKPLNENAFNDWLARQWLQNRASAYLWTNWIAGIGLIVVAIGTALRLSGVKLALDRPNVNVIVVAAIVISVGGTLMSLNRTKHPTTGNDQKAVRKWEAISTVAVISIYTTILILSLP